MICLFLRVEMKNLTDSVVVIPLLDKFFPVSFRISLYQVLELREIGCQENASWHRGRDEGDLMYAHTTWYKKWIISVRSTSSPGLCLICLPLRLVCSPLPAVGLYPGGRRCPRVTVFRRSVTLTLAATSPTATTATTTPSTTTGLYFPSLFLLAPHFLWLPVLFSSIPFACLNLFHLPACALLSRIVNALLHLSYPSLHGPFFFLALFECILIRLHVLQDQPCQSDPRSEWVCHEPIGVA